jgi:hypothetical protein
MRQKTLEKIAGRDEASKPVIQEGEYMMITGICQKKNRAH